MVIEVGTRARLVGITRTVDGCVVSSRETVAQTRGEFGSLDGIRSLISKIMSLEFSAVLMTHHCFACESFGLLLATNTRGGETKL